MGMLHMFSIFLFCLLVGLVHGVAAENTGLHISYEFNIFSQFAILKAWKEAPIYFDIFTAACLINDRIYLQYLPISKIYEL